MKRAVFAALLFIAAPTAFASIWGDVEVYATLSVDSTGKLISNGGGLYREKIALCMTGCGYEFKGLHQIRTSYGGYTMAQKSWRVTSQLYRGSLTVTAASGECYFAQNEGAYYLTAYATLAGPLPALPYELDRAAPELSSSACRPAKPVCPGDPSCPPTGTACGPETPPEECQLSPIILNLGRGAYELSDAHDPVEFDLNADGRRDRITWTARDAELAFLALDRNGNGVIDDGSELFGNAADANGFAALARFDLDADGAITPVDPVWPSLLLWTDADHDGLSDAGELQPLRQSSVRELGLQYHSTMRRDRAGNVYRYQALARDARGAEPYYDIFFAPVP
ncbi:MAG TPA: hypothetical protein VGF69_11380 [Thermoanaerobaculia bacterium]|jgi:hypothetical protein